MAKSWVMYSSELGKILSATPNQMNYLRHTSNSLSLFSSVHFPSSSLSFDFPIKSVGNKSLWMTPSLFGGGCWSLVAFINTSQLQEYLWNWVCLSCVWLPFHCLHAWKFVCCPTPNQFLCRRRFNAGDSVNGKIWAWGCRS